MTNQKTTSEQILSVFVMFSLGSGVILGFYAQTKQDSWICALLSGILFLPLMALYLRVIHLYPGLNLFEIIFTVFGRLLGSIFSLIYILFAVHLGSMVTNLFSQYIVAVNMSETPKILIISLLVMLCVWSIKNGAESIGRISKMFFPFVSLIILLTFIVGLKDMDFNYLKPVLQADTKSLLNGAFFYLTLSTGEIFFFLTLHSSADPNVHMPKIFIKGLVLTVFLLLITNLRNILLLGSPNALRSSYPSYNAVSIISVGTFFTRIEVLIGINMLLAGFIKICVCLYSANLGLTSLFHIPDQKKLAVPCGLLMIAVAGILNSDSPSQIQWLKVFPIYSIPFEFILPVILWIGAEIRAKMKPAGSQATGLDSSE
ncbi:MAG TPA: endospore germination permease [Caproiciproducens sp.]|nr:endospore germination permease [Caproiciproducens sp.]